jgi:hypothetical protein
MKDGNPTVLLNRGEHSVEFLPKVIRRINQKLRRERPANNPIGDSYLELHLAFDPLNPLVPDLWRESGTGVDVDLLLGLTA